MVFTLKKTWYVFLGIITIGITAFLVSDKLQGNDEINSMNNEYGNCLDVIFFETPKSTAPQTYSSEDLCRIQLRDNPVCIEAFETAPTPKYFKDELECRGFVKHETNCETNAQFMQDFMGLKCP